ncbi:NAD(P)H-binding protein [Nonomuraea sp. NPDC050451]|uniref:NAD(P)H-binding protein n=1 Tax=Nonomuraea sp. NPDC050451 TaxID=3364364 RepID=UPI00379DEEAF
MIMVIGATGTIGREVLAELRRSGVKTRALTRDPARAGLPEDVEVVRGDLGDPATLPPALDGVTSVFLTGVGHRRAEHDRALVRAARAAGVAHVVQLSSLAVEERTAGVLAGWHLEGERAVRESGLRWTILRPNGFMSNALQWAPAIAAAGVVRAPYGDLPSSVVHPGDVAAVAAAVLLGGGHDGAVYPITGPQALTPRDQVRVIGEVLGRPLRFEELPVERAREQLLRHMPPETADAVLAGRANADLAVRARVDPTVAELTGRPARTFREWATQHFGAGHFGAGAATPGR